MRKYISVESQVVLKLIKLFVLDTMHVNNAVVTHRTTMMLWFTPSKGPLMIILTLDIWNQYISSTTACLCPGTVLL